MSFTALDSLARQPLKADEVIARLLGADMLAKLAAIAGGEQ